MYALTIITVDGVDTQILDTSEQVYHAITYAQLQQGCEGGFDKISVNQWINDGLCHDIGSITVKVTDFSLWKVEIKSHKLEWVDTNTIKHHRTDVYATLGFMVEKTAFVFDLIKTHMLERGQSGFRISDAENLRLNLNGSLSQTYTMLNHRIMVRIDKVS